MTEDLNRALAAVAAMYRRGPGRPMAPWRQALLVRMAADDLRDRRLELVDSRVERNPTLRPILLPAADMARDGHWEAAEARLRAEAHRRPVAVERAPGRAQAR